MLKKFLKTLSVGLSGLLALGIGIGVVNASNVLHEMVPHVVLPETIQYNKTAKNAPGTGYFGVQSPYVATYVAYPSYQIPHTAVFRPVGQSVYPVSPMFPIPLPEAQSEPEFIVKEDFAWQEMDGEDIALAPRVTEPIRLAAGSAGGPPRLPMPEGTIMQTQGLLCQKPASPPSAWAFSSPLFKVASVPAGWGGQQAGGIIHSSPRGSQQQAVFQPAGGVDPAMAGMAPQGIPYSTFQMGQPPMGQPMTHNVGPQYQVLPNGMVLLMMPPDHANCGLIRCRSGSVPRTVLLPPAGFGPPQAPQGMMAPPQAMMMPGGFGTPFMQVSQQPMMMPPQMIPQMQTVPVTAMTPMGPAIVGYQQVPMMNPTMPPMLPQMAMSSQMAMMPPMMDTQMPQMQMPQMQMAVAMPSPMVASQVMAEPAEPGDDAQVHPPAMALIATPFGYAIQVPTDALQGDAAAQLAQMQQALVQSQMPMQAPVQVPMPMNPYAGMYATPFGYGQPMMMPVGYSPMGMAPMGMAPMGIGMQGGGMSVSDMIQILTFINSNKPRQRTGLAARIAERRETRKDAAHNDPFAQLMQAWTTPHVAPDTTLKMPSRNAYPYGYFGVQASPVGTANYGGYHNLYFGNTTYPGLY